jgi:hypothetical protein
LAEGAIVVQTNDLIERLAADLRPVRPAFLTLRLATGLAAGAAVSAALLIAGLGLRPDLAEAAWTSAFWIKFAYTLVLAGCAFAAVWRLARPGGRATGVWLAIALVFGAVVALALVQLALAAPPDRMDLVMGGSASQCPWLIALLSAPILAGAIWAMRRLAPTDLTLAGWGAGLAAGSFGAWIYAFHCYEPGIPFLALWYTVGIVAVGALGALLGRVLLRW